ncbi:MAG: hypothetical protein OXG88_00530 [Gammaproteobacteria bacterium]|nr:hypothetical protein [Gammaproteobacteria bacterium]
MKTNLPFKLWLGIGGLCLIALNVVVFLWLRSTPPPITAELPTISNNPITTASPTPTPTAPTATLVSPRLPPVDYPQGSVGHACAVNEFPPYHWYSDLDYDTRRNLENHPFYDSNGDRKVLKGECNSALERHISSINPYLWGAHDENRPVNRAFSFIVIDNPLTFERIFADPAGDFARVQEAFARPECQLGHNAESNWELNEICHADAILNYALITRFCYNNEYQNGYKNWVSERTHQYYLEEDKPTPEQDRRMWIQNLEDRWVKRKCETLDPNLNLHSELHTELRHQIQALQPEQYNRVSLKTLIELAARLGDDAAALTQPSFPVAYKRSYHDYDEGYKHGPFAGWFTNKFEPTELFVKYPPTVDRLRQVLSLFSNNLIDRDRRFVAIDHDALVQHLCTPPYYDPDNDHPEPASCREIINELRQESHLPSMLEEIATFKDVAIRLDVYE